MIAIHQGRREDYGKKMVLVSQILASFCFHHYPAKNIDQGVPLFTSYTYTLPCSISRGLHVCNLASCLTTTRSPTDDLQHVMIFTSSHKGRINTSQTSHRYQSYKAQWCRRQRSSSYRHIRPSDTVVQIAELKVVVSERSRWWRFVERDDQCS